MFKVLKKIILICSVLCITIFSYSQNDSRYDAGMNLPFNEKAGDVNPQTGNITLSYMDVSLPGRAGYNFSFGRIWSLNQSNVFNMYAKKDGSYIINRLNSNTIEKYNNLGIGWNTTLPYIYKNTDTDEQTTLNLFYGGSVYEIDKTGVAGGVADYTKSNLVGYDLLDLRVYGDTSISYADYSGSYSNLVTTYNLINNISQRNKYMLVLKDNEKYFFDEDGSLMMQEDRSQLNRIWYFYAVIAGEKKLKVALDTVGREIEFKYINGNISEIEWTVDYGKKDGENRSLVTGEKRSIKYEYESGEDTKYTQINGLKSLVQNYETPYVLTGVRDQLDYLTKYEYKEGRTGFSFDSASSHSANVYLMLTDITEFNQPDGSFKSKRSFEYDAPAKGMFTKYFYNGYMEYYKISRQYYTNLHNRVMNDARYAYYDKGEGGNYNQYSAVITMGNVKYTYIYSLSNQKYKDHVLDNMTVETIDGFVEKKVFVYNDKRTKTLDQVFRQGKYVYEEAYAYDEKGNLKYHKDRIGLVTTTIYDDVYSIPLSEEKLVTVGSVQKTYKTENVINALGQVIEQIVYIDNNGVLNDLHTKIRYDAYGNVVEKEDPKGNVVYTVYDAEHHAYPVKIYQDVDIASWNSGTVHDNWQTEPSGTKKVRLRSWKVFNSDGSVWIEIDNEGYAIEHYYDKKQSEIEVVNPDLNDTRDFAQPIEIVNGNPVGTDFDDFTQSSYFNSFLTSRVNNPGARMIIDYPKDLVRTYADISKGDNEVKVSGKQGDGLGHVEKEIEYTHPAVLTDPDDITEYAVKNMEYDNYGRMIAMTDPDAGSNSESIKVNDIIVDRHDKTWIVKCDDLGRKKTILYPTTKSNKVDVKTISYDDYNNLVTTIDPEGRKVIEKYDWNGNVIEVDRFGDSSTSASKKEIIKFSYDEINRKVKFADAKNLITTYKYDERNLLLEEVYNNGSDVMNYNELGQLIKKTDRKGQVITFNYDQMGRNTDAVHYKSLADYNSNIIDHTVALSYDNRGNAVRIANQNLIEHYIYDYANRVIKLERKIKDSDINAKIVNNFGSALPSDGVYSFDYVYNDAGMVRQMTYPDASIHRFEYDAVLGRLSNIKDNNDLFVSGFEYNKSGVVSKMNYANDTFQTWDFDNRKRISNIHVGSANMPTIQDLKYTLNSVGDILGINDNEYVYDGFDRIIGAKTLIPKRTDEKDLKNIVTEHFGAYRDKPNKVGITYDIDADLNLDGRINGIDHFMSLLDINKKEYDNEAFEYDKNGNRTKLTQNGDIYFYTYSTTNNQLIKVEIQKKGTATKTTFAEYEYDANGNITRRTINKKDNTTEIITFTYDTMNRLIENVKTAEGAEKKTRYYYDNAGNRFIKQDLENNVVRSTTLYLRHGQIAVAMDLEMSDATGDINRYVLSGDLLAGRITKSYANGLPVTTKKSWYHLDHLNSTKCVTDEQGHVEVMYEYRAFGEQLKRLNQDNQETADKAKYSYQGKELDQETNLEYFNARYYDPTTGRYINVDPIQSGYNWYVFCNNNPMNAVDPTGLSEKNLYTTNGTILDIPQSKGLAPENYYKSSNGNDSQKFTNELGSHLGMNKSTFVRWDGGNDDVSRQKAIDKIYKTITEQAKPEDQITLFGHSHGGNVMIKVADTLQKNGYNVQTVYTADAPARAQYIPTGDYQLINYYSTKDKVQSVWGNQDTNGSKLLPLGFKDNFVNKGFYYNGATPANITNEVTNYLKEAGSNRPGGPFPVHQATRDIKLLKEIMK